MPRSKGAWRGVVHLGAGEKAIVRHHHDVTVVADLDRNRILCLAEDRKRKSLDGFWATLTWTQREGIQAIAMDMREPSIESTQMALDDGNRKIGCDTFHIVTHLRDAMGTRCRRQSVRL